MMDKSLLPDPADPIEFEGETVGFSTPSGQQLEEDFAFAQTAPVENDANIDRGPEGHYYYDDAIDENVVRWCVAYAKAHPEDEYIQARVQGFREQHEALKTEGKQMPGFTD